MTDASYVFHVEFRLDPDAEGVRVQPDAFETTVRRSADEPGESGWLFFRDNCWRGELNDPQQFRDVVERELGVTVTTVEFRELRTSGAYLDALEAEIADNLDLFNAESTTDVLSKYLGSSIHVTDG